MKSQVKHNSIALSINKASIHFELVPAILDKKVKVAAGKDKTQKKTLKHTHTHTQKHA